MKMERRLRLALISLLLLAGALGTRGAAARKPLRVLLVLAGGGPHDVEKNPPHLERALLGVGGVELTRLAPPPGQQNSTVHLGRLTELKPGDYDVLAFYTVAPSLTPEQESALRTFVESGGGLVAIHGASASFRNSQTWFNLIGARFAGHAPGTFPLQISILDPRHPIVRGLKEFAIVDEEYTHQFPESVERHVIAGFKQRPPNTVEKKGNNDAVWTINAGKGRVVYTALGHGEEAWKNPAWQKLIIQSLFWAAGHPREVKIPQ